MPPRPPPENAESDVLADADADEGEPIWIAPLLVSTPVMNIPAPPVRRKRPGWEALPKGVRTGFLRIGEKVHVHPRLRQADTCSDGWYELIQGGFVCSKYVTADLKSSKVRLAPHPPYSEGPLPYDYGANTGHGTPLYRTVPSSENRLKLEPWRAPPPKETDETAAGEGSGATDPLPASPDPTSSLASRPSERSKTQDAGTPWYLRELDGGKLQITLGELHERGQVARRMVRGFIVSLDKKFQSGETHWWRTVSGLIAPVDRISLQKPRTGFHGVWIGTPPQMADVDAGVPDDAGAPETTDKRPRPEAEATPWIPPHPITHMPVGIMVSSYGRKYTVDPAKRTAAITGMAPRFTIVGMTGQTAEIQGRRLHETDDGWWMADGEGVIPEPGPKPEGLGPDEKWIDVNVTRQWLIALEGDRAVYVTLVSSGKKDDHDKERDHRTVTGSFRIREKHISATMDDDSATDGPYSIEDVPWIMYFRNSYALHGAFWHAQFGYRKSHGCVNLAPFDAKALFFWTEPQLPKGWHAVMAASEAVGTRVVVHE